MFSLTRAVASMVLAVGILFSLASNDAKAQVVLTYSGELSDISPTFARPHGGNPPTTVATATTYKYHVRQFTVATSGIYSVRSLADYDNFTALYTNPFTPGDPLANIVIANDDLGNLTTSGFNVALTANVNYTLVTTSYSASTTVFGTFTNTVTFLGVPPTTTFQRPNAGYPPATGTTSGTYYYYTESWTPATAGLYKVKTVAGDPANFNTFTVLYSPAGFSSAAPLTNAIVANDTFTDEGGASGFYFSAVAGQTYTIVVSSSAASEFGSFTNEKTLVAPLKNSVAGTTIGAPPFTDRPNAVFADPLTPPFERSTVDAPYVEYPIVVSQSGNYTFHLIRDDSVNTTFDTYLLMFTGALNLDDPLSNALAGDDDFDTMTGFNRSAVVNIPLTANTPYTVVITGYATDDEGGFLLEAFGPGNVQIVRPVDISGTITTATPNESLPITFVIRPVGGTAADDIVKTVTVITNSSGVGSFEVKDIPPGMVNLVAKGELTLQTLVSNINATNDVTGVNITLRSGDANQDNFADISDLTLLIQAYNRIYDMEDPGNGYSALVDFNYDNANDIGDLLILIGNYNQASQFLP